MGLRQDQLDAILKANATASTDAYENVRKQRVHGQQQSELQQADADAKLAQLIKGKALDAENEQTIALRDLDNAQALREQYGQATDVSVGRARIGGVDPLMSLLRRKELSQMKLTPAQEAAEKKAGQEITAWEMTGGRPAMQKNLNSLKSVQDELKTGKRDAWDRGVGAVFGTSPGLLGVFGSAEKERRDKARNTALTIARQTDPNPTEKQIEAIMGQIYDPASSDADNQARIERFLAEQEAKMQQMEAAASNYDRSGYATIGGVQSPRLAAPQGGKVRVSNGTETLEIDPSDLAAAQADGYQVVR